MVWWGVSVVRVVWGSGVGGAVAVWSLVFVRVRVGAVLDGSGVGWGFRVMVCWSAVRRIVRWCGSVHGRMRAAGRYVAVLMAGGCGWSV